MAPNPWTSGLLTEGTFPYKGVFPANGGRWKNKRKPLPMTGNYVTIGGHLQQAVNRPEEGGPADSYIVEVDNVTFSPRSAQSETTSGKRPVPHTSFITDPREALEPTTPSPLSKKRKLNYVYNSSIPSFTPPTTVSTPSQPSIMASLSESPNSPTPTESSTPSPSPAIRPSQPEMSSPLGANSTSLRLSMSKPTQPQQVASQGQRPKHSMTTRLNAAQDKQSGKELRDMSEEL